MAFFENERFENEWRGTANGVLYVGTRPANKLILYTHTQSSTTYCSMLEDKGLMGGE